MRFTSVRRKKIKSMNMNKFNFITITGASGTGKTTLVQHYLKEHPCSTGFWMELDSILPLKTYSNVYFLRKVYLLLQL